MQTQKLEQVRRELRALQDSIRKDKERASAAADQLRKTEQAIGGLTRELADLDLRLEKQADTLGGLRSERKNEQRRLADLQDTLAAHVRSAYALGRQGRVKLLLSQEDPATVSRVVTYFRYLSEARAEGIEDAVAQLARLEELETGIARETQVLEDLQSARLEESQRLEDTRVARAAALKTLNLEIDRKGRRIDNLKKDEDRLQKLVESLQEVLSASIINELADKPFKQQKGRLHWPVAGRLTTKFGQQRKVGNLKWRGLLISSSEGEAVRAVSHGRVAYADWLRGFGLLIILEHGDGYMTLYGYNQSLHKEVGDWVAAGELIARVGNSGGQQSAALYFELRHQGRPVNPMRWFQGQPSARRVSR